MTVVGEGIHRVEESLFFEVEKPTMGSFQLMRQYIFLTLVLRSLIQGPQVIVGGGCGTCRSSDNHL